jgi:hypothetical protein
LHIDNLTVDVRLDGLLDPTGDADAFIINPSFLVQDGEFLVAARRHRRETVTYLGVWNDSVATIIDQVWHSQVLLGWTPLNATAWAQWPSTGITPWSRPVVLQEWQGLRSTSGAAWQGLCVREAYIPSNNTVIRHVVTGPEDPKPFALGTSHGVAFNSMPPASDGACRMLPEWNLEDAVSQMYLASFGTRPSTPTFGYRLQYGDTESAEKNWIPFTHDGSLYFVYTPLPHVIVEAQPNGTSAKRYSSTFRALQQLVQGNPSIQVRGSGQAHLINDPEATPNLPEPHYLALLHLYDDASNDASSGQSAPRYAHFAYRFAASPPFEILQVSAQLPLTEIAPQPGGPAFAFASGLVLQNRTVVVTYGAGDRESRALVLTLGRLDEMFACK